MTPKLLLKLLTVIALACCVALVLLMVLHAPVALAVFSWMALPVVSGVLIAQLVSSQKQTAKETEPSKPGIVVHEDGSIEVQP